MSPVEDPAPASNRQAILCSPMVAESYGQHILSIAPALDLVVAGAGTRPAPDDLDRVEIAYFSTDLYPDDIRPFFGAAVRAPNLRWFHSSSAGVDDPVFPRLRGAGARVTNSSGAAAPAIARTVAMYLLALSRNLPALLHSQSQRRWEPRRFADLEGRRVGVLGLGPIGLEVARLASALGLEPVGMRRSIRGDEPCETWTFDRLPELISSADVLVLALPLAPETRGLLSRALIETMRPGAIVVNVGRGELLDEDALADALANGHLAGAGLDVFAVEPLPSSSPLWRLPNVIVTPHISGSTECTWRRSIEMFLDNLAAYVAGDPLRNEIIG